MTRSAVYGCQVFVVFLFRSMVPIMFEYSNSSEVPAHTPSGQGDSAQKPAGVRSELGTRTRLSIIHQQIPRNRFALGRLTERGC